MASTRGHPGSSPSPRSTPEEPAARSPGVPVPDADSSPDHHHLSLLFFIAMSMTVTHDYGLLILGGLYRYYGAAATATTDDSFLAYTKSLSAGLIAMDLSVLGLQMLGYDAWQHIRKLAKPVMTLVALLCLSGWLAVLLVSLLHFRWLVFVPPCQGVVVGFLARCGLLTAWLASAGLVAEGALASVHSLYRHGVYPTQPKYATGSVLVVYYELAKLLCVKLPMAVFTGGTSH